MFNPYQAFTPLSMTSPVGTATTGIAKTGINWANLLSNTQKTLNIVNQAIPLVYQVKPIVNNAKTMFKVASEFSKSNNQNNLNQVNNNNLSNYETNNDNGPKFFI